MTITLPLRPENAPRLGGGDRITVWASSKACRASVILSGVAVQDVKSGGGAAFGSSAALGVVVRVRPEVAQRVVSALDLEGAVLRIGVLASGQQADATPPTPTCAPAK